ncbi:hypothetical protein L2E82_32378 [Cichorium intybus]|uniref:Uncharacterized protein n=1 Tax=Cichorium intybus TaxID=13427 RepID=A0ACB9BIC7_CICIN|nr:hypothetical protein L2E82_32378 [Cichorium intybus]
MNSQMRNTMEHLETHDAEATLSLSDLHIKGDTIDSEEVSKANQSSSSSSSSSFDDDFLGFFSEEWSRDPSHNTSHEDIIFFGRVVSIKTAVAGSRKTDTKGQTSPLLRSSSDSFRFMRLRTASKPSTPRSKSLPNRVPSSSTCKSKWQVFMFGFGSGKFPTKMDMSDIKSRQFRQQSTVTVSQWVDDGKKENLGRRSGKKGWWQLVNILGCSGGYEKENMEVI